MLLLIQYSEFENFSKFKANYTCNAEYFVYRIHMTTLIASDSDAYAHLGSIRITEEITVIKGWVNPLIKALHAQVDAIWIFIVTPALANNREILTQLLGQLAVFGDRVLMILNDADTTVIWSLGHDSTRCITYTGTNVRHGVVQAMATMEPSI